MGRAGGSLFVCFCLCFYCSNTVLTNGFGNGGWIIYQVRGPQWYRTHHVRTGYSKCDCTHQRKRIDSNHQVWRLKIGKKKQFRRGSKSRRGRWRHKQTILLRLTVVLTCMYIKLNFVALSSQNRCLYQGGGVTMKIHHKAPHIFMNLVPGVSYGSPLDIDTKLSTSIPCMTWLWRHNRCHVKNSENCQKSLKSKINGVCHFCDQNVYLGGCDRCVSTSRHEFYQNK